VRTRPRICQEGGIYSRRALRPPRRMISSAAAFISSINPREVIKLNDPRSPSIIRLVSAYLFRRPSTRTKARA